MHRSITTSIALGLLAFTQLLSSEAYASAVEKVSKSQAIVVFDQGETPAPGDKFFALDNGKRRAVLEVVQFKNGKAKVKILKGKPAAGMDVAAAGKGKAQKQASAEDTEAADAAAVDGPKSRKKKRMRDAGAATLFKDTTIGIIAGYSMDSQQVSPTGQTARSMTGSGMSAKGFLDVPVTGSLNLYARFGAEQFNVTADAAKTEILYGVADLLLKYAFSEGTFVPFAMAGLGIHFPLSKTSDVLNPNNISPTTVFYGGGGFNYAMGGSTYIQATAEYGMFTPSNEVSTSLIAVRGGLGFRF